MSQPLVFQSSHRAWALAEILGSDGRMRQVVRIGARDVPLADVADVCVERHSERDVRGLLIMGIGFLLAAQVILIAVSSFAWRERYLIGAAVLCCLAMASLFEVRGLRPITYCRLTVTLRDGSAAVFTFPDNDDVQMLAAMLSWAKG